jgi:integrase
MTGHIRRRGKRSWAIILDIGEDPNGKRRQKWHSFKGTKKEAEVKMADLVTALNTGAYVPPGKLTVSEFLEKWLAEYAVANVSPKTYERYEGVVNNHLVKAFGSTPLVRLQPMQIQASYTKALLEGRADGREGGLSARTVLHHHRILHEALGQAVKWQLLARNPADAVEPPRPEDKEVTAMDETASALLIDAAIGTRLYMPILLACTTGMRRGEILALRWKDCDLRGGVLTVNQAVEETRQGIRLKAPKGRKGRRRKARPISLPALLVEALREHRREQDRHREMFGADYDSAADLVCCGVDGSLWKPSAFTSAYRDLLRRREIPNIGFHNLRHSHASQLLRNGINPKVISERLGHSRVGFTLEVYSHLLPGMQEEAAKATNSSLGKAIKKRKLSQVKKRA